MKMRACVWITLISYWIGPADSLRAQPAGGDLRADAVRTLKAAATFYREKVASHGGYVYYYTPDLKERWGEGAATVDTIFVQPPGTPTVGTAYLRAYGATKDSYYLDAARETAEALVYGQLQSGGWTQVIHFAKPEKGRLGKYRNGKGGGWNVSSLDDGQTQAALQFLVKADETLGFKHAAIHDAAGYGLDKLLQAQYANGAFPQGWLAPAAAKPVAKATFPDYDWKTEGKIKDYWACYTLNDNLAGTVADTLIEAYRVYRDEKYKAAVAKLGDFLILAQLPEPQPGWCQQYNFETVPIWARKFEPPAVTGWESQDVMRTLIRLARFTGGKKYLEPIPRALAYFKKSLLPDGRVARYYEFKTNKPLYMDAKYQLTYDDAAVPDHYGWKQAARFDEIEKEYKAAVADLTSRLPLPAGVSEAAVKKVVADLDAEGRWVTTHAGELLVGQPKFATGFRYISSDVFSRNVETLSQYLQSVGSVGQTPFPGTKAGEEKTVAGIKLCWCPAGKFVMGSPAAEVERRPGEDQVEVTLTRGFWMAKYEATQGEWKKVYGKLPGKLTEELPEGNDYPVGNVNFPEVEAYCVKLTELGRKSGELPEGWEFRLPTEAQWEYACRAGTTTVFSFGNSVSSKQANFKGKPYGGGEPGPSIGKAVKVGQYPANPWGLHDMHGNTFEWCRDWYHAKLPGGTDPDLRDAKETAVMNRTGDYSRVRRGGAWTDDGWACRSAFRLRFEPERRYDHIGFRVAIVRP